MKKLITNRYYITTIIAIFLSLSLGILIGGTLGQQWINGNQQRIISHYESKVEKLDQSNQELMQEKEEINSFYLKLKSDYKLLFTKSIGHTIEGKKILWINDTEQNFQALRNTIELAGATILEHNDANNNLTLEAISPTRETNLNEYDVILFFPTNTEQLSNYKWLLDYGVPVIYVTDNKKEMVKTNKVEIDMYEQKVDLQSLYEQYQFVHFLKNLLQETINDE